MNKTYTALMMATQAIGVVFYLLLARIVGPGAYGRIMAMIAVATMLSGLMTFGANSFYMRELVAGRMLQREFVGRFASRAIYCIPVGCLVSLWGWRYGIHEVVVSCGCGAMVLSGQISQLAVVPLMGTQKFISAGVCMVMDKVVCVCSFLVLFALHMPTDNFAPWCIVMGNVISSVSAILLWSSTSQGPMSTPRARLLLLNPWRGGAAIGVASVLFTLQQLDVTVLRSFGGAVPAGEYAAVNRWAQPVSLLSGSISQVKYPKFAAASSDMEAWREARSTIRPLGALAAICAVGAVVAPWLAPFILGAGYAKSSHALSIVLIGAPFAFASQVLYYLLLGRCRERPLVRAVCTVGVLQLVGVILVAPTLGAVGTAACAAGSQVLFVVIFLAIIFIGIRSERASDVGRVASRISDRLT